MQNTLWYVLFPHTRNRATAAISEARDKTSTSQWWLRCAAATWLTGGSGRAPDTQSAIALAKAIPILSFSVACCEEDFQMLLEDCTRLLKIADTSSLTKHQDEEKTEEVSPNVYLFSNAGNKQQALYHGFKGMAMLVYFCCVSHNESTRCKDSHAFEWISLTDSDLFMIDLRFTADRSMKAER